MAQKGVFLIVGADGMLGSALAERLRSDGQRVLCTAFLPTPGAETLDLATDAGRWTPSEPVVAAFLCGAVTSLEYCRVHPAESWAVNVYGTLAVARTLIRSGARVLFPSSNLVFDGSTPCVSAAMPLCPQTVYGRQKAEVETALRSLPGTCVVRFTKILGRAAPLLVRWAAALRKGEPIHPFADMVMAPAPVDFAVQAMIAAAYRGLDGVLQVSADTDITYSQAALHVAERVGASPALVQPISALESGVVLERPPAHTALDTERLRCELGLTPPSVWRTIEFGMTP